MSPYHSLVIERERERVKKEILHYISPCLLKHKCAISDDPHFGRIVVNHDNSSHKYFVHYGFLYVVCGFRDYFDC
jgi:hypothetical protein